MSERFIKIVKIPLCSIILNELSTELRLVFVVRTKRYNKNLAHRTLWFQAIKILFKFHRVQSNNKFR